MADHGTAAYTLGQFAEVQVAITRALPKALKDTDPKEMIHAVQNGETVELMLAQGFSSLIKGTLRVRGGRIVSSFTIRCEGTLRASELVKCGKYDWVHDLITDERFPLKAHEPVTRKIELVEFDYDPISEEVLDELRRLGLERPTPEDAFYSGIDHLDEQRKRSLVFLHEPVLDPAGNLHVLVLNENVGRRDLYLRWFDDGWDRNYLFAGVRPSTRA